MLDHEASGARVTDNTSCCDFDLWKQQKETNRRPHPVAFCFVSNLIDISNIHETQENHATTST